jgi:GNAT superfamily N-acetyltransferase
MTTAGRSSRAELRIALAEAGDRDALLELLERQFAELEIPLPAETLAAGVDGALADGRNGSFLIGRRGGATLAVAYLNFQWSLEHGGLSAWLEELFVLPEHRCTGVGGQMLDAACAHAVERGCAAVDLEVEEAHPRAARLYERAGFAPHRRARWVKRLTAGSARTTS